MSGSRLNRELSEDREGEVEVSVSERGDLLVGVETGTCSVLVSLDVDPDSEDVEEALRTALREARHSRALGRSDA
jgi:hypothetical protein